MAFTKKVIKNSKDSHQSSPGYLLTFTRYEFRDTVNYTKGIDRDAAITTRQPLVVVSDATQVKVNLSKANHVPTFSCVLKQGDLNYLTAIHPGDYVTVNMVNWKEDAMKLRTRALQGKSINRYDDGFKGLFKILDVRMTLQTNPSTGAKEYHVQVTGKGFDEFNNILYFNPALVEDSAKQNTDFLFLNNFSNFTDLIRKKETNNVQDLVKAIIKRTIGEEQIVREKNNTQLNQIAAYLLPTGVGKLLNRGKAKYISQINNYYTGIWGKPLSSATGTSGFSNFFDADGEGGNFFKTKIPLEGARSLDLQDFQYVSVWSLIQDYGNKELNDIYTCYRVDKKGKHIYPTLIVRQKPFTTNHYEQFLFDKGAKSSIEVAPHTKFLDLPRWDVDPDMIVNLNIGRSDAARINFVQISTRALSVDPELDQSLQITAGNFVEDSNDVIRNGRRPYVRNINYDFTGTDSIHRAKKWSRLVADWVFNGHLKMNGTIECIGLQDPICIGDNLQLDGIVYHIESISHAMSINPNGVNTFRTQISLSMGVDADSPTEKPLWAEMDHTDARKRRVKDWKDGTKILPGFSDTQDLPGRTKGEEVKETEQRSFSKPRKDTKK